MKETRTRARVSQRKDVAMRTRKLFALPLALALVLSLCVGAPTVAGAAGASRFWGSPTTVPKKSRVSSRVATDTAPGSEGSTGKGATASPTSGAAVITTLGPVCEIGGTPYDTLDDALAAITDNTPTTIKLLADITYTNSLSLTDRNITFDLAGFNLTFDCATATALSLKNCNIDYNSTAGGVFQIKSGVAYVDSSSSDESAPLFDNNGAALFVDGGSCQVSSVLSTGDGGLAVVCTSNAKVRVGIFAPKAASSMVSAGATSVTTGITATGVYSCGVMADVGCSVVVEGISATAVGVLANGANIDVLGDITVKGTDVGIGIDTEDFTGKGSAPKSVINVWGNITAEGNFAVGLMLDAMTEVTIQSGNLNPTVSQDSKISVNGAYGMGIAADSGSTVTMKGNITGSSSSAGGSVDGIDTGDATVSLTGAINVNGTGIFAMGGTTKVTGNITATGDSSAIDAESGTVSVTGAVKTTGDLVSAVYADSGTVTVNGSINAAGKDAYGVEAYDEAKVTVSGDVTANGYGVFAMDRGTEVYIKGNIVSKTSSGAFVDGRATVTVDGTITAADAYVEVGALTKEIGDFSSPTTKAGYKTYTDGKSTVWVKDTSEPKPPVIVKPKPKPIKTPGGGLPGTGDAVNIAVPGALLIGAIAASVIVSMKRRASKES